MTVTIGRATLTDGPYNISHSGDQLSFSIDIFGVTPAEAKVLRQQLLGLVDNDDEPVVPVTWSDDSDFDGFYRVTGVSVDPATTYLSTGLMRCQISLERVGGGYATAVHELVVIESPRDGVYTVTDAPRVWLPSSYNWLGMGDVLTTRTTDTGGVTAIDLDDADTVSPGQYTIDAADHYDGACLIEVSSDAVTWYPVVGTQVPVSTYYRIGNGLLRFAFQSGVDDVTVGAYDAGAWIDTACVVSLLGTGTTGEVFGGFTVSRNSVEAASIMVDVGTQTRLTVGIMRGDQFAALRFSGPIPGTPGKAYRWNIVPTGSGVAMADEAIRFSLNAGAAHLILDPTDAANPSNTVDDFICPEAGTVFMVGWGQPVTLAHQDYDAVRAQSWTAISQRQSIVTR